MAKQYTQGQITAFVSAEIKAAKHRLGIDWRGLIVRGIKSATGKSVEEERAQTDKITRLSTKINDQAVKIFNLEQKANK